jgi:predicted nucleotidyltransferase
MCGNSRSLGRDRVANWPELKLEALLRRLVSHGVDFVVVGGIAMVAHGSARLTNDLDICFATDAANLDALGTAMVELGATPRGVPEDVPFVPDAQTLRRMSILTLISEDGNIDLLVAPAGSPPYRELRDRAKRVNMAGIAILVASLDDLEAMKRASGRPKDKLDLEEIEVIRRLRARGVG